MADLQAEAFLKKGKSIVDRLTPVAAQLGEAITSSFQTKLGEKQPGWMDLASSTQQERISEGYTANEPLLRSGVLRDAFTHEESVSAEKVVITAGIKNNTIRSHPYDARAIDIGEMMVWQETGTANMAPRPLIPFVVQDVDTMLHNLFKGKTPEGFSISTSQTAEVASDYGE